MPRRNCMLALGLGLPLLITGGCADDSAAKEPSLAVESTATAGPSQAAPDARPRGTPPPPPAARHKEAELAFEWPFPDRNEIFLPPRGKPPTRSNQPEARRDVALMGFANVWGIQALLRIDGIVTPLRAGESRGEVRVLAIDPPKVDLQRGERRWTESLLDRPTTGMK
jgi:hypothetical protein